jgi:hypothetical protein
VNELRIGARLGSGGEKDVFAVEGRDDIVIGIAKADVTMARLATEAAQLKELADLGIPVVEIEGIIEFQGRPALIMKRYVQGSKTIARTIKGRAKLVGQSDLLNARSIRDLERIRDALKATPVWINDLQFLIGEDGAVVVADVLDFKIGQEPSKVNLSTIDRLIEAARNAIAQKGSVQ